MGCFLLRNEHTSGEILLLPYRGYHRINKTDQGQEQYQGNGLPEAMQQISLPFPRVQLGSLSF